MGLQDGLELVEGDEWTDDVRIRALLAAVPLRFVDGRGAVGDRCGQRTCPLAACSGLIVGLDRARTNDMRVAILDEVRIPMEQ